MTQTAKKKNIMKSKNKFKILIVGAFPRELKSAKEYFREKKPEGIQADFLYTWMGNYKTVLSLTQRLEQKSYDFLLQLWICGKKYTDCEEIIQIVRIKNISSGKELCIPIFEEFFPLKSIACSEKIIYKSEEIGKEEFVDMESYGFELCASEYMIPRLILKIPYDTIGEETKNFCVQQMENTLENVLDFPYIFWKIQKYLEKKSPNSFSLARFSFPFPLTESETHIFQFEIQKFLTLGEENFEEFLQEYCHLWKKEFLKKLQEKNKIFSTLL